MLAGHPPFHPDVKYRSLCAKGKFYPLKGPNWDSISAEAKDLVTRMLTKDPAKRIDMDGVCNHPWLQKAHVRASEDTSVSSSTVSSGDKENAKDSSEKELGEAYAKRVKNLVLKNKLKKCFLDDNIETATKDRRANFVKTLSVSSKSGALNPFEQANKSEGSGGRGVFAFGHVDVCVLLLILICHCVLPNVGVRRRSYCVGMEAYVKTSEYNAKLLKVRAALVEHIFRKLNVVLTRHHSIMLGHFLVCFRDFRSAAPW